MLNKIKQKLNCNLEHICLYYLRIKNSFPLRNISALNLMHLIIYYSFQAISPNAVVVRVPNSFPSGTLKSQRYAPQSPACSMDANGEIDHPYMNITPGDPQTPICRSGVYPESLQTPTTSIFPSFNTTPRLNSISSATTVSDINRVYENLDTAEIRPLLSRASRFSKPDLFAKPLEPPQTLQSIAIDKSEPSTPTIHYIVLDLDHTSNSSGSNPTATSPTVTSNPSVIPGGGSMSPVKTTIATPSISLTMQLPNSPSLSNSLGTISPSTTMAPLSPSLPPESPKKGIMDYAKIDFNKTVALSNSANPSSELDSEESRKTRHSSVAKTPTIAAD